MKIVVHTYPGGEVKVAPLRQWARFAPPSAPRREDWEAWNSITAEGRPPTLGKNSSGFVCPLDIDKNSQDFFSRLRPGRSEIRQAARNTLRRAICAVEEGHPGQQIFITLTLPGSSLTAVAAFSALQGKVQSLVRQRLADEASRIGAPVLWACKWEYQERGALHVHLVLHWPKEEREEGPKRRLPELEARWRRWWHLCLKRLSEKNGIDLAEREGGGSWLSRPERWQVAVLRCENAARYLSKYCSKYLERKKHGGSESIGFKMSRPWSISAATRDLLLNSSSSQTFEVEEGGISEKLQELSDRISGEKIRGKRLNRVPGSLENSSLTIFADDVAQIKKGIEEAMASWRVKEEMSLAKQLFPTAPSPLESQEGWRQLPKVKVYLRRANETQIRVLEGWVYGQWFEDAELRSQLWKKVPELAECLAEIERWAQADDHLLGQPLIEVAEQLSFF